MWRIKSSPMRTESDDNFGWPAMLKTILQTSGPVAVIALLLVWYLMTSVNNQTRDVAVQVKANHEEILAAKNEMHAFATRQIEIDAVKIRQNDLILKILRQMCVNSSDSPQQRSGCYE
jgi:hypothetical protein